MAIGVNIAPLISNDDIKDEKAEKKKPLVCEKRKFETRKALRIDEVVKMLGQCGYVGTYAFIHKVVKKFNCSYCSARIYITEAQKIIREKSGKDRDTHIAEYLNNIDYIINNAENQKIFLQAIAMKSKLLGLDAVRTVTIRTEQTPLTTPELQQKMLTDPRVIEAAVSLEEAIGNG